MRKNFRFELEENLNNIKINLTELDSDLWNKYYGAYEGINELIKGFISGEGEVSFEEVCLAISHQMTFYPAIYLVFPYMVEMLYEEEYYFVPMVAMCLATDIKLLRGFCSEDGEDISLLVMHAMMKLFCSRACEMHEESYGRNCCILFFIPV